MANHKKKRLCAQAEGGVASDEGIQKSRERLRAAIEDAAGGKWIFRMCDSDRTAAAVCNAMRPSRHQKRKSSKQAGKSSLTSR